VACGFRNFVSQTAGLRLASVEVDRAEDGEGTLPLRSLARAALVGVGATVIMDAAGEVLRRATGVEPLDYRLVGRWLGHMRRGGFRHESIRSAEPVHGERAVGWLAHYSIGTGFAVALEVATGPACMSPRGCRAGSVPADG
jgi:hypothetical protein